MMIYVCSPYRGDVERNVEQARWYCQLLLKHGEIPFAPHLYFTQFLDDDDPVQRERGLDAGLSMMRLCSAVYVFGDVISEGMRLEIEHANKTGKAVKFLDYDGRDL